VSADGELMKAYSRRDGMGVERLRDAGIETAIVTREESPISRRRAEKLGIRIWSGVRDKRAQLGRILDETRLSLDHLCYVGDDVNDLGIIEAIHPAGLTAAPADAMPEVRRAVHFVSEAAAGRGAFREVAEWLLGLRAAASPGERDEAEERNGPHR
jgi:3-deoxy-D-manno-octulosonate 8-phosphate phosphatase (KDO 8-P phosphatase)